MHRAVTRPVASATIALCLVIASSASARARCRSADPGGPRTIVIALDGVPFRVAQQARERGAFENWPDALPLVSTFPSITNVAFTALLDPFDVEPARGYEVQHFDKDQNEVVGGRPNSYHTETYAWRELFDVTGKTFGSKLAGYVSPKKKLWKEMDAGRAALYGLSRDLVLVHGEAADALGHLRGDPPLLEFLLELDTWLVELQREHLEAFGRPLRIVLLSDHGITRNKVHRLSGIRRLLRKAGLQVVDRLVGHDDVIAATFGLVSYGALFLRSDRAEIAASAVAGHKGVNLAAWVSAEREISVVSKQGKATIHWTGERGGLRLAYRPGSGDPLQLTDTLERLSDANLLDDRGFASENDWFTQSALAAFPDGPRRLFDALTGTYVKNVATVMFSLRAGYAWGWRSGHASSWLNGGRIEGTHGGLDRDSTLGFFLTNDAAALPHDVAVAADGSLASFAEFTDCLAPNVSEDASSGPSNVEPDSSHQGQGVAALNDARP